MTNDKMTNNEGSPNDKARRAVRATLRDFAFRHYPSVPLKLHEENAGD
jgi:hypothetical protein